MPFYLPKTKNKMHALIEDQIYIYIYILQLELPMEAKRKNVAQGKANTYHHCSSSK